MQIKIQLGKLTLTDDLETIVKSEQEENSLALMPKTLPHIINLKDLPYYHKDPFDRLLIAQSQVENATLISRDSIIKTYDCAVIWS